ncbi:RHS repeat domain-containing protein [Snodgrassella alvi]|uniref:RHS repeat domain-containing protein n=1 Tax=Snodgrassella alvi TaxID=1196083 RepID=UPI000C1EFBA0|nr:RHS repeat-associated core domain-containing protein [Snodgrassella alvi]
MTDENGKILWECSFQLWGKRIHEIEHEPIEQNLRYQGQYLDRETGLHYNTFRYYDPDIGRFTQPDPIGLLGGFNLYQYAPNGLTWIDPLGFAAIYDIGTYGSLNGKKHVGDNLQAHELIRHEYLKQQGLADKVRLASNPAIALDLDHHTRSPSKDSRGIGGVHYHEKQIRAEKGLGPNQFMSTIKEELDITSEALRRAGVPEKKIGILRGKAEKFYKKLSKC